MNGGPHRFLVLLFGASGFLGLLDDGVEGDAQPAHARQVGHVDVKLQPLVPQRLRAHRHLGAGHHLAEQLAAVEQAGQHHKLEGERRVIKKKKKPTLMSADEMEVGEPRHLIVC